MRKYSSGNGSLLVKGVVLLLGLIVVVFLVKTIVAIVGAILILAALTFGLMALFRYLGRNKNRYY